ncbi:protein kinase [Streptomyces sp. NPDC059398]|uniref:serine/threonine-protein kinase n=1 Tax=Streptomyces sp. NPDC059398 TaxID=3346820 RepID=UPI0036D15E6F
MTTGDVNGGELVGRVLGGRYRVTAPIGRGGMGVVARAVDQLLSREVAVKILRAYTDASGAELADLRARMHREAQAAARIRHPGVVTVHDVTEEQGLPVIVMELVDGPSLDDVLTERGTLAPREAAEIGARLTDALDAAHRVGVLHRDVKPGNVLLERGGRVVLTDFGIASMETAGDGALDKLTRSGELVGSLDYLPPERAQGMDPGPASDIWALGMTLYAAVEGAAPFRRTSAWSTLAAIVTEPLPEPRRAGPLAPVLRALMAKEPADRPTADQARRILESVAAGQPHPAPPPVGSGPAPGGDTPAPYQQQYEQQEQQHARQQDSYAHDQPPYGNAQAPYGSYGPASGPAPGSASGPPDQPFPHPFPQPGPRTAEASRTGGHRTAAVRTRRRGRTVAAAVAAVVIAGGGATYAVMTHQGGSGGETRAAGSAAPGSAGSLPSADGMANGTTMPGASASARSHGKRKPSQTPVRRTGRSPGAGGAESSPAGPTAKPGGAGGGGSAGTPPGTPAPPATKPSSVSKSCGGWNHQDPNPGSYAAMAGSYHLETGPYQSCPAVALAKSGVKVWFHCYVTNAYGNRWTYVRIAGTNTSGWMSNDNFTRQSGPSTRC